MHWPGQPTQFGSKGRRRSDWRWAQDGIWFRPLFALFVIDIKTREVIHVGVTRASTEVWTAQQLRNIKPFGEEPILGRRHFASVLENHSKVYFNGMRPHQGIGQRIPVPTSTKKFTEGTIIESVAVLGGLHHDYRLAAGPRGSIR